MQNEDRKGSDPPSRSKVRPSRTASVSPVDGGATVSTPSAIFVGREPHLCAIALFQTVPHAHPHCLVPSRLRFFTQDAYARPTPWAPSFLVWMNTGRPTTSARCGFQHRPWAVVVIALRSAATTHPWAAAILMASLRRSLLCGVRRRRRRCSISKETSHVLVRLHLQHESSEQHQRIEKFNPLQIRL